MRVRDLMTHPVQVIGPDAPAWEAVGVMRRRGIRRLPVVEGGALVGIVTWTDLVRVRPPAVGGRYTVPNLAVGVLVRHLMTPAPATIGPDAPIAVAAALMRRRKIGGLPVVDGGDLVGILTESDVFDAFVEVERSADVGVKETAMMRILVPVDLGPDSATLLRFATRLAARVGAEVTVLHVYAPEAAAAALRQEGVFVDLYVGRLRSELGYLMAQAGAAGRGDRIEVIEGQPVEVILARARQMNAQLIVMQTHQRTGLPRLLMGSVAEGVLRRAPCPVVLVPEQIRADRPREAAAIGAA
jgi:acetoin utilization protein AcuB